MNLVNEYIVPLFLDKNTSPKRGIKIDCLLGPYRLFCPGMARREFTPFSSLEACIGGTTADYEFLKTALDGVLVFFRNKHRCKYYILFSSCALGALHNPSKEEFITSPIEYVSKTAILDQVNYIRLLFPSELKTMKRFQLDKLIPTKKGYNLDKYFRELWIPKFLGGEIIPAECYGPFANHKEASLDVFTSLYISRKQGWI